MPASSATKKAIGASEDKNEFILLVQNTEGQGNYHSSWLERTKSDASEQNEFLALYLSFLDTGRPFVARFPNMESVTAANTQPAIPAAAGQPAVAAVVPGDDFLEVILKEEHRLRARLMSGVANQGTAAFNFLKSRCSGGSWAIVKENVSFAAADAVAPKDGYQIYRIIVETHALGGAGGVRLSSQEVDRIDEGFNSFRQNGLDVGEYYRLYNVWIEKRRSAGIPDLTGQATVSKFYSKLNPHYYSELLRERENNEKALNLTGLPVPDETLHQALQYVRAWKAPAGTAKSESRSVSVFAVEAPEADAIKDACAVLAAAAGTTSKSVLLALRNASFGQGGSSTTNTVRSDSATMSVNGRPWTRRCSVHGCSGIHPFYMHAQITGQPVDAVSQAKMDAFAARKNDGGGKAGASKKPKANRVLAATATTDGDDDDDDDDVEQYFIHVATSQNLSVKESGDEDDDCYTTAKYSVLVSSVPSVSAALSSITWSDVLFILVCIVVAVGVGSVSVWLLLELIGHMMPELPLQALAVRMRSKSSPFDSAQLLFDNQAGISIIKNVDALVNVRQLPTKRIISGISGDTSAIVAEIDGELPGLPGLRFLGAPTASANILAECDVRAAGWSINLADDAYVITTSIGTTLEFRNLPGWTAHPTCRLPTNTSALVTTVASNLAKFSKAEQTYAARARHLQNSLGLPCDDVLIKGLSGIDNSGVTPADVRRANAIAGPAIAKVRGGTHQTSTPAQKIETIQMPWRQG